MHLNWLAKIELRGPGPPNPQIVVNYCFMRVLHAKIFREIKSEEAIGFFVTFLSLVVFHLGGARVPLDPLATPKAGGELLLKNSTIDGSLVTLTNHAIGRAGFTLRGALGT